MGSKSSTPAEPEQPKEKFLYDAAVADALPLDELSNEQIVAISRQLKHHEAHAPPGSPSPAAYAQTLVARSTPTGAYKVPTVRFGKTELQMPILTCGGMRVQQSWMPDHFTPGAVGPSALGMSIGYHKMDQIDPAVQANLIKIIRRAISHGIVHFETARFYGTSEMQYADALATLIESGEVARDSLIIQTKVMPCETNDEFLKTFEASWKHLKRLGHIDLLGFHGVSNGPARARLLRNCEVTDRLVAEGRVRHVGFSTHGSAREVRLLIETGKMSYVNLHAHYFGDYHAAGTSASADAELGGNLDNLRLAREKYDMGCFLISPYDKGGMLYAPSKKVVMVARARARARSGFPLARMRSGAPSPRAPTASSLSLSFSLPARSSRSSATSSRRSASPRSTRGRSRRTRSTPSRSAPRAPRTLTSRSAPPRRSKTPRCSRPRAPRAGGSTARSSRRTARTGPRTGGAGCPTCSSPRRAASRSATSSGFTTA